MKKKGVISVISGCESCELPSRKFSTTKVTHAGMLMDEAVAMGAPARFDYDYDSLTMRQKHNARFSLQYVFYVGKIGEYKQCPSTGTPCPNRDAVTALNGLIVNWTAQDEGVEIIEFPRQNDTE